MHLHCTQKDILHCCCKSSQKCGLSRQSHQKPKAPWCRSSANDDTAALLAKMTKLTLLDLRYGAVTNTGMAQISGALKNLTTCNIEGLPLTSLGVWRLLAQHKKINAWGAGIFPAYYLHKASPCSSPTAISTVNIYYQKSYAPTWSHIALLLGMEISCSCFLPLCMDP